MIALSTILRRALSVSPPLRLGLLQWTAPDRLRVCLHEPDGLQECAEIEVRFTVTGVRGCELVLELADVDGDPSAAAWYDRHGDDLLSIYDEWVASRPTSPEGAVA